MKKVSECVICEEFINEKFVVEYVFRNKFRVNSKYREDTYKSYSVTASREHIAICRGDMDVHDVSRYKAYAICIKYDLITISVSNDGLYDDDDDDDDDDDILLQAYNDKIVKTTSRLTHENNIIVKKDTTEEIEYANRIRYVILRKITPIILKICERINDEINKNENENKNKNKTKNRTKK